MTVFAFDAKTHQKVGKFKRTLFPGTSRDLRYAEIAAFLSRHGIKAPAYRPAKKGTK